MDGGGPWRRVLSALHHSANAGSRSSACPCRTTIPPAIACCSSGLARGASISSRIPGEASTLDVAYPLNFLELRQREVRRIHLLRGSVNRFSAGTLLVLLLRGGPTGPTVPCTRVLAAGAGGTSQYRGRGEGCCRLRLRRLGL